MGEKFYVQDNRDTPDTMLATFRYPKFLASYESRTCNPMPMFAGRGSGTTIHGTEGTIYLSRSGCWVYPNPKSTLAPAAFEKDPAMSQMNVPHWMNFLECIKTREKPISEIETCVRSSTACLLANLSMRHKKWLDWDEKNWTVLQNDIKPFLKAHYRSPWKLEV